MNGLSDVAMTRRILVVEDEVLICLLIETILMDANYDVVIANNVAEALEAIDRSTFAAAILDLNLKGNEKVYPVATRLASAAVPFIFATGGGGLDVADFPGRPWIAKPFRESELLEAVDRLVHSSAAASSG